MPLARVSLGAGGQHLAEVARVPLLQLRPLERGVVIGLGPDRGRIGGGHLALRDDLLRGRRRRDPLGDRLARGTVQAQRAPCGVGGDAAQWPRQRAGDLAGRRGGEIAQLHQALEERREILWCLRRRGRGLLRGRLLRGLELLLVLGAGQQGGALHGQRARELGERSGERGVLVRAGQCDQGLRAGRCTVEHREQVDAVEIVDPGRRRGVLLRAAQRDRSTARERQHCQGAGGAQQGTAGDRHGGAGGTSGRDHRRILASGALVEARARRAHYPGGTAPRIAPEHHRHP